MSVAGQLARPLARNLALGLTENPGGNGVDVDNLLVDDNLDAYLIDDTNNDQHLLNSSHGFSAEAGFSISGEIVDGNTVTISGTGFGTKAQAAPKVFDTFDIYYNNGIAETPYSALNDGDTIPSTASDPYDSHVGVWTKDASVAYGVRSAAYKSPVAAAGQLDYHMETWLGWPAPDGNKLYARWYIWLEDEAYFQVALDGNHASGATNITTTPALARLNDSSVAAEIIIILDDNARHRTTQSLPKISTTNFDIDDALPSAAASGKFCYVSDKDTAKLIRVWDTVSGPSDILQFSWTMSLYEASGNTDETDTDIITRAGGVGQWNLLEIELFHPQEEVDIATGVVRVRLNGVDVGSGLTGVIGQTTAQGGTWPFSGIQPRAIGMDSSPSRWQLPNNFLRLAEIYADTTTQRIEIGNHATDLFQSTIREVCMLSTWSDGSIDFIVNLGELGSLTGKYLYIVDSNNIATLAGQFT